MRPHPPSERRDTGRLAEELAARMLVRHGAKIVARNLTVNGGEVDIVAEIEHIKTVVEVRSVTTRASRLPPPHPLDAFDDAKCRQVRRLANALRCQRVDLVAVRFHNGGVDFHWVKNIG
jgi:Holliday junction resolvase-like predicted endonuclease